MGGKSTLGECFEAWLEGKEMSQELLPIVFVKVKVNAIMSVDVVEGVFKADFVAMFDWFDPSLEQQILERRLFDFSPNTQALFFSPVVWIDNGENAEVAPIGGKSETRLGNRPGHVKRTCRYLTKLVSPMDCKMFPFDGQILRFEFKSAGIKHLDKDYVVELSDTFFKQKFVCPQVVSLNLNLPETWRQVKLYHLSPRDDYYHSVTPEADKLAEWEIKLILGHPAYAPHDNKQPAAFDKYVMEVVVLREPLSGFYSMIAPVGGTCLLSFVTYIFDASDFDTRSGLLLTLVLTIVAFKFVIAGRIPAVPYLTDVDRYVFCVFVLFMQQLFFQAVSYFEYKEGEDTAAESTDQYTLLVTGLEFLLLQVWIGLKLRSAIARLPTKEKAEYIGGVNIQLPHSTSAKHSQLVGPLSEGSSQQGTTQVEQTLMEFRKTVFLSELESSSGSTNFVESFSQTCSALLHRWRGQRPGNCSLLTGPKSKGTDGYGTVD